MLNNEVSDDIRLVARSAARWLALIDSGQASERDQAGLRHWREQSPAHEHAWQKAQALRGRFSGLPSELAMASLDRPDQGRRRLLKGMLGLAAVAPAGWLITRELPFDAWRADLSTGTGQRRRVDLNGGAVLELNTASAVNIEAPERRLRLVRGEIALTLSDTSSFIVDTAQGQATLHQGQLCVRQDDGYCEFAVVAGSAEIRPAGAPPLLLQEGERVRMGPVGAETVRRFDPRLPGWREGVLMANEQPLGDFLRELDRYRPGILRWSPALERLRVTGSFRVDDTDTVLALLAASLPLEVRRRTRYWVTLVPREKLA